MQVSGVTSSIVSACNGGCDAFDINRSLAAGLAELNPAFLKMPLSMLVLGIIVTQSPEHRSLPSQRSWSDLMPETDEEGGGK